MKSKLIISLGLSSVVLTLNCLSVFAKVQQEPTKQSSQGIQSLPNGVYFYGQSRLPNQAGRFYVVLRKTGNTVIGMLSEGQQITDCFRGTANRNTITNVTLVSVEMGTGRGWQSSPSKPINLNEWHRIDSNKIPEGASGKLQECIQLFSNRR